MPSEYTIRKASAADIDTLVAFTLREAREAEDADAADEDVRRGVRGAFADPPRATYWVAEGADGRIVASTSVVGEWSNFHGGDYWWIQSLFIDPEHRGRGLVDQLLEHLEHAATAAGALELRLYAHRANERAIRVYRRCGFVEPPYLIMRRRLAAG